MATNDEIIAKLPLALVELRKQNKDAATKAAEDRAKEFEVATAARDALEKGSDERKAMNSELAKMRNQDSRKEAREKAAAASTAGQAIALKAELENQGKIAEDNKEFQKLSYQARKEDYAQRLADATSPAAKKEIRQEARADAKKNGSKLDKIGAGISGLWEMGKKGMKAAALGGLAILSTLAIGAFMIALGKFLQSDTFKDMTKFIQEEILPYLTEIGIAIASIVGAVAIVKFIAIAKRVRLAFLAVQTFMKVTMLENVKGMIGGVVGTFKKAALLIKNAFIAVQVFALKTMLPAIQGMVGGVVAQFASIANKIKLAFIAVQTFMLKTMLPAIQGMIGGALAKFASIAKKIKLAFLAVQAFMMATMLPAITAFMVPLLPVIAAAAAVSLILYSLWEAFKDFNKTLDETGSIGEAIKKSLTTFYSTLYGIIPALFLKLVAFVADMFGFEEFAKKIGDIDPIAWIAKSIEGLISDVVDFFKMLFDFDFAGFAKSLVPNWAKKILGISGSEQTPEQMTQERVRELESKKEDLSNKRSNPENRAEISKYDAEIEALKLSAAESLAKPTVLPKTQLSEAETLEAQRLKPAQFKESASIVEKLEKAKQQAELARQQTAAAGQTNIVDARQSSSVTTTGQSGNSPVVNPKYGNLNSAASGGMI